MKIRIELYLSTAAGGVTTVPVDVQVGAPAPHDPLFNERDIQHAIKNALTFFGTPNHRVRHVRILDLPEASA